RTAQRRPDQCGRRGRAALAPAPQKAPGKPLPSRRACGLRFCPLRTWHCLQAGKKPPERESICRVWRKLAETLCVVAHWLWANRINFLMDRSVPVAVRRFLTVNSTSTTLLLVV